MSIRIEEYVLRVAGLSDPSKLPMIEGSLESVQELAGGLPDVILAGSRYGSPANLYPLQEQNLYDRTLHERTLTGVVLENHRIRAVFLPELGGRLWRLTDRERGVELLHSPRTIQYANLALRNAWFAGGVEWNIAARGHSPTTCDPLHAAIVTGSDGSPSLRMWEFDRLREVVFQIDAWLPEDSRNLFVAVRIRNPNAHEVPMYWWSNAAVPQSETTRVIAPASSAFATDYGSGISRVDPTNDGGVDGTWPSRNPRARDFFFDIPPSARRWVVASDHSGDGLAIASTAQLRGRKLFVWGHGRGGRRWQKWLSPDGEVYAEIQAGLAQTQYEHLRMPSRSTWSWVESYGNGWLDPTLAAGDWENAVTHGRQRIDALVSGDTLESALRLEGEQADIRPGKRICDGSGWGALEAERRRASGLPWIDETGTPFATDTVGSDQQPWLELLRTGQFTGADSFVRGTDWEQVLDRAHGDPAAIAAHRAVQAHARGDRAGAKTMYEASLATTPNALAHRGRALLALDDEDGHTSGVHYAAACELAPGDRPLLAEAATASLATGDPDAALMLIDSAPDSVRAAGRILLLRAHALAAVRRTDEAIAILRSGIEVPDLREGENSMAALWRKLLPEEAVPAQYEFSMGA